MPRQVSGKSNLTSHHSKLPSEHHLVDTDVSVCLLEPKQPQKLFDGKLKKYDTNLPLSSTYSYGGQPQKNITQTSRKSLIMHKKLVWNSTSTNVTSGWRASHSLVTSSQWMDSSLMMTKLFLYWTCQIQKINLHFLEMTNYLHKFTENYSEKNSSTLWTCAQKCCLVLDWCPSASIQQVKRRTGKSTSTKILWPSEACWYVSSSNQPKSQWQGTEAGWGTQTWTASLQIYWHLHPQPCWTWKQDTHRLRGSHCCVCLPALVVVIIGV